ncbi:hypothetical protein [Nonomuraea rhizosphaerae]|uniref:hypothetical protein n=1 Tax=Nonomuraea rhizosphaerae TaxID=2665663 RepID=UPI001C5D2C56|nr:hypothetical protein [Nonomuraea rhizosphaerae]
MIVCYARGDGLGHLTRMRAYLHTVHPGEPATILTAWPGDISRYKPAEVVVDAFPAGLDGEVRVPPGVPAVHLARLLRWEAYRPLISGSLISGPAVSGSVCSGPVRFDRTWVCEPVSEPHLAFLHEISGQVAPLELTDPPAPAQDARGDWLIVHSGPPAETMELVAYARESAACEGLDPRLVLVSPAAPPGLPPGVTHTDVRPAWPLFATAGRIVSAAGFNVVRQAAPYRHKHRMMPFPRRFDDQFTRAARARSGTT